MRFPQSGKWHGSREEFFGTDTALYTNAQSAPNAMTWAGWSSLGGIVTSNITAARNADGRLEIFARGTDSALYHASQTAHGATTWSTWESLGGNWPASQG